MLVVVVDGLAEFMLIKIGEKRIAELGVDFVKSHLVYVPSTLASMSCSSEKLRAEQYPWNSMSSDCERDTGYPVSMLSNLSICI